MSSSSSSATYHVAPRLNEKGLGIFADKTLAVGDVIVSDSQVFAPVNLPRHLFEADTFLDGQCGQIHWTFNEGDTLYEPNDTGAIAVNGIEVAELGIPSDSHIFDLLLHLNHSCSPNAAWTYNSTSGVVSLRAATHIPALCEITVAYFDCISTRYEREKTFVFRYSFICDCYACNLPSPLLVESDARRLRVKQLDAIIARSRQDLEGGTVFRSAKEQLRLLDEERLWELQPRAAANLLAAEAAVYHSDYAAARRHFGMAYALRSLAFGRVSSPAQALIPLCLNPSSHPFAGTGDTRTMPSICDHCGIEAGDGPNQGTMSKGGDCGECHCARYCSRACKAAALVQHRPVCQIIKGM